MAKGQASFLGLRGRALDSVIVWGVIGPAYILFGYNNGVAGGLLDLQAWINQFPSIDTLHTTGAQQTHNSTIQGTVVALYTLGCFFGSLSCILIGDPLGRIRTIMLGAAINIVGAVLQASSFSLGQLIVGRLVSGFGVGALTATAPNWQTECSKAVHRGKVLLEGTFIGVGLSIASWVNFGISHAAGEVAWRFPLALSGLWSFIIILVIFRLPESPRWLMKQGRVNEARLTLSALWDTTLDAPDVDFNIREIEQSLAVTGEARFLDIFRNGPQRLFHRTCLAAIGQLFQQMNGINALAYYIATIFQQYLGLSAQDSAILGACYFMFLALCTPIGVFTVERFGRRKLMMFGAVGMGVCMAVAAGTMSQTSNRSAVIATATFMFLFNLFFGVGFFGITFLYAAEIAPLSHRVPITSISTGFAWLFNFVVAEITPVGLSSIHWRYYIIYACINLFLILPSIYVFYPETKGRSLEEVDEIFLRTDNIFSVVWSSPGPESPNDPSSEKGTSQQVESAMQEAA